MSDTPEFLNAQRAWNEHVAREVSARTTWQMVAIASLGVAAIAVGGMAYIGAQSKLVPYIVEVDRLGQAVGVGVADKAGAADARIIRGYVAAWIADARTVTVDSALLKKAVDRVYAHVTTTDAAHAQLGEWFNGTPESNPFKRAADVTVSVEISSVLQQTPDSWQVEWAETTRSRKGEIISRRDWRAVLTVRVDPAQVTEKIQILNPLGVFVSTFSWSALQ